MVQIEGVTSAECPYSVASRNPEIDALARQIISSRGVQEFVDAVPYGHNTSKWPARWHDAVSLAASEERRIDAAITKHGKTLS